MGKGGKNKKNKSERAEVDINLLSLRDEASTSQTPSAGAVATTSQTPSAAAVAEQKPADSKPPASEPKPEEDDESGGLGLGGARKKRPRKKKKETVEAETAQAREQEKTAIQAPEPSLAAPSEMPGTSRAWGRGQQQPPVFGQQPVVAPQPPPGFAPPIASPPSQVPSAFPESQPGPSRGRGRGQPVASVSVLSEPVPHKPVDTVCRFKIPDKIIGRLVTSQSRAIKILTNYLEMKVQPIKINRYDVSIKPDRPKKLVPKAFAKVKEQFFPKHIIAFDQKKNCYSIAPLWAGEDERKIVNVQILDDNDAMMKFEVTMKFTGIVDLGTILAHMRSGASSLSTPMEAIQCIDVILQQGTLENYVKAGRQFFKRPRNPLDLSGGLEMWTGLFQSAIFTSRAFINIDVAHKGFPKQQSLISALTHDFRLDPTKPLDNQRGVDSFISYLKGLRVNANIGGSERKREYICNSLVGPPHRMEFTIKEQNAKDRRLTVEKYFLEKKCRLRYPNLNCLWVGPKDKNIYYPLEFLEVVPGQALNKQLNENQLRTMVREAAAPPNDRMDKIKEVINNMNYSGNPCFKHFKLEVANSFFQVNAKVLPVPKLDIGGGRSVEPRKGAWQATRFFRPSALDAWGFIAIEIDTRRVDCGRTIDMIKKVGCSLGMNVAEPRLTNFNARMIEIHKLLLTALDKGIKILFVVVPGRQKDAYDKVKCLAELKVGMITQCIKENTVATRMSDQTIKNILLKVNSKLMGVNQALEPRSVPQCIREGGVMVVGADVTHPSPDQSNIPSIAAVTASFDSKCYLYNIELSIQTPKNEIIVEFEDMMFDHLNVYRRHYNTLPKKIFVFRDGVSEGQFAQVMNSELVAVQKAYSRLEQRIKPEILFLLVQKRHHTRFFISETSPYNVEPGTVVDSDIVHYRELDFYLVSHQAIKGTARPTRYHVVCNDGNIPSDEVEQLAFYLCHLYSRCMRSVSYPAPTYYAHLACLRARALTSDQKFNNADLEKKPQRLRVLDRMLQNSRMFFV